MPISRIPAGNMCDLFARYLDAKFVLMHISYPYTDELVALAKHYRNIWVDLCWAWEHRSVQFPRLFAAVPARCPIKQVVLRLAEIPIGPQARWRMRYKQRNEIRRALEGEITDGYMTEAQAMQIATRIMRDNQYACFDVQGTRANIRAAA